MAEGRLVDHGHRFSGECARLGHTGRLVERPLELRGGTREVPDAACDHDQDGVRCRPRETRDRCRERSTANRREGPCSKLNTRGRDREG